MITKKQLVRLVLLFSLFCGVVLVVVGLLVLRYFNLPEPTLRNFLPELSLYISSVAASIGAISALIAWNSLQLTRERIRPFISFTGEITSTITRMSVNLSFKLKNSGSMPGENVYVAIDPFKKKERIRECNLSRVYSQRQRDQVTTLWFPDLEFEYTFELDLTVAGDQVLWHDITNGDVTFRIRISYYFLGEAKKTVQSMHAKPIEGGGIGLIPRPPQIWT
jgi:hypothetical protein